MSELAELLDALIKRLDVRTARFVAGIIAVAALAGCVVFTLRDYGSLLPLLPAFMTILLLGGGFWLIRRHLLASSEPDDSQTQGNLAPAPLPKVEVTATDPWLVYEQKQAAIGAEINAKGPELYGNSQRSTASPKHSFAKLTLELLLAGSIGGVIGIMLLFIVLAGSAPTAPPQPVQQQDNSLLVILIMYPIFLSAGIGWVVGLVADLAGDALGFKPPARRAFRDTCTVIAGAIIGPFGLIAGAMGLGNH